MTNDDFIPIKVICTGCGAELSTGFERDGEKWGRCLGCGREDTMQKIADDVAAITGRRALDAMFGQIELKNVKTQSPQEPDTRWKPAD